MANAQAVQLADDVIRRRVLVGHAGLSNQARESFDEAPADVYGNVGKKVPLRVGPTVHPLRHRITSAPQVAPQGFPSIAPSAREFP